MTSFMNQLDFEFNDVFTCNSDESLDRINMANEQSSNGTNDQDQENNGTNQLDKWNPIRGRDDPCDSSSGEVGATSTSKEWSTLMKKIRDHISITIPIFKCLYFRGTKQFWITHRNVPHTDYTYPVEIQEPMSKWEFYTMLNKKPFYERNSSMLQSIYNSLGLLALKRRFSMDTWENELIPKTYIGGGIKSHFNVESIYDVKLELTSLFYSKEMAAYVYCSFVALISTGAACSVWYKMVPCGADPMIIPDAVRSLSINQFYNHAAVVEGYQHISFLYTKDIQPLVFDLFANDETFRRVADLNDYDQVKLEGDEIHQKCVAGFLSAMIICMYITSQFATGVVNG